MSSGVMKSRTYDSYLVSKNLFRSSHEFTRLAVVSHTKHATHARHNLVQGNITFGDSGDIYYCIVSVIIGNPDRLQIENTTGEKELNNARNRNRLFTTVRKDMLMQKEQNIENRTANSGGVLSIGPRARARRDKDERTGREDRRYLWLAEDGGRLTARLVSRLTVRTAQYVHRHLAVRCPLASHTASHT
ncbi:hypothetical protein J6590_051546 [Homalodisca vitripennis]|nr:hypothetical protein J6590_051546 [Homalodisca vitripennis]